jgi:hypothetical protein
MGKTPYDRWLKFISWPTSESGIVFPRDEAKTIRAIPLRHPDAPQPCWRRDKREINRAVKNMNRARK